MLPLPPIKYIVNRDQLPIVTVGANSNSVIHAVDHIGDDIIFDIIDDDDHENNMNEQDPNSAEEGNTVDCHDRVIYLTQNDFKHGTYRIRKCGEYVFTEDIIINFNAPTEEEENDPDFSPNQVDDNLYWYPTRQQANHETQYPGTYNYVGSFSLGFFTGKYII